MAPYGAAYFIDSGYLHFAMKYGIFIIILLVALYVLSLWKAYKKKDYYMIGIYIMLSVFCINDIHLISAFNRFIQTCFSIKKNIKMDQHTFIEESGLK